MRIERSYSPLSFTASEKAWYAVYTVVRHEKAINEVCCKHSIETFLPLRETVNQWSDRKKRVRVPLFPGYLFVNILPQERWSVLSMPGVVRILGVNGTPVPVPEEQIDAIRRLLDSGLKYDPYSYLTEGREVVVIRGPLEGVRGKILKRRGNYRLVLSVDLILRSVSVEIDIEDVEPV